MSDKPQLPNRRSVRLSHFDYSQPAAYFLTICTHNHQPLFGDIILEEMVLNTLGNTARECWLEIPLHFARVRLGPYVIMPNHLHGIVILAESPTLKINEEKGR